MEYLNARMYKAVFESILDSLRIISYELPVEVYSEIRLRIKQIQDILDKEVK